MDRLSACHWCADGGPAAENRWWRATQKTLADRRDFQIGRVADGVPPEVRPCQTADFVPPKKRWWTARSLLAGMIHMLKMNMCFPHVPHAPLCSHVVTCCSHVVKHCSHVVTCCSHVVKHCSHVVTCCSHENTCDHMRSHVITCGKHVITCEIHVFFL